MTNCFVCYLATFEHVALYFSSAKFDREPPEHATTRFARQSTPAALRSEAYK